MNPEKSGGAPPGAAVAVLGASPNPERTSNRAVRLLDAKEYSVFPIHLTVTEVEGIPALPTLSDIQVPVHTLSIYLNPDTLATLTDEIIRLNPERVIFNPGTESPELQKKLNDAGISWLEACTLVLLATGQF